MPGKKPNQPPIRVRTTIVIEAQPKDLEEGLRQGVVLARERVMYVAMRSKRKDGPWVSCRTTKVRAKTRNEVKK